MSGFGRFGEAMLGKIMGKSRRMLDGFYDQSTVAMAREWLARQGIADKVRVPKPNEVWPGSKARKALNGIVEEVLPRLREFSYADVSEVALLREP